MLVLFSEEKYFFDCWCCLELQRFFSVTSNMNHWSWISRLIKTAESSSFYILRLATVFCLHRNKYCMEQLTSPCRIPVRYYTTTSWQDVCWWLLNTNKSKARHSATTVAVQWEGEWVSNTQTHTHTCLSSFLGNFQCAFLQQKDHKAVYET